MTTGDISHRHDPQWVPLSSGAKAPALAVGLIFAAGILGLWLLQHPYEGIIHDAWLYVGHVLAAADPRGIGQDIVFTKDGQFGFSLYPPLLAAVIGTIGVSMGAKAVSLVGLLVWFAALCCLAASIGKGRDRWTIVAFVAVLPTAYGGFDVLHYAEAFAAPRVYGEAGVLLAFAFLCWGRPVWALATLAIAALLHPIMVLPGLGVWAWVVLFDPRTRSVPLAAGLIGATAAVLAVLLAAALHLPLAERLFVAVEPARLTLMMERTPYLFPSLWPAADWSRILVQFVTLAIAASLAEGRLRALLVATIIVGLGGLAAAYLLGDVFASLLALQVQLWRATWIVAVIGTVALALASLALWRQGENGKVVSGLLLIAWLGVAMPVIGVSAALLAALVFVWTETQTAQVDAKVVVIVWAFVAVYALLQFGTQLVGLAIFAGGAPEGVLPAVSLLALFDLWTLPVCALALLYALAPLKERWLLPFAVGAIAVVILGLTSWDIRDDRTRATDEASGDRSLRALLASRPGDVLWLDGRFETWSAAGRPNWFSTLQGASVVFSQPLAEIWSARAKALADLGVVDDKALTPFSLAGRTGTEGERLRNLSDAALEKICAWPDAPAWIVVPADAAARSAISSDRWPAARWRASAPKTSFTWTGDAVAWRSDQDYAVFGCAP